MLNKSMLVVLTSWLLQGCAAAESAGGATAVKSAGVSTHSGKSD